MSVTVSLPAIGVGIDTARYGHCVSFLRPDRQAAAKTMTIQENHEGYEALRRRLEQLHQEHPQAHFHVRIDAAGQYASNLERFVRGLPWPMTISIGEPKRNKDYQKAHFPKRTTDTTESIAMARFAIVEQPDATATLPDELMLLREVAGRLQAQTKQSTQAINRLHNLLARVFPELASFANDFAATWVLELLTKYPTSERIAQARLASLEKIPFIPQAKVTALHGAAQRSVGSLRGELAETLVKELVAQVRHCQMAENKLRQLLTQTYAGLPESRHQHLTSIPGIGEATAAVLVAKIADIDRFQTPEQLVGYFGVFPAEHSSGVDKKGQPLPLGTMSMSPQGNDLVRSYLWMAARSGIGCNPALRSLYRRLKARGKRGDVALGHCMAKLLHLVFAIWKSGKPFDPKHFPWDTPTQDVEEQVDGNEGREAGSDGRTVVSPPTLTEKGDGGEGNNQATGHKPVIPASKVVTAARTSTVPESAIVDESTGIDFAHLKRHLTMARVLEQLGLASRLRGSGPQRRCTCPLHRGDARGRTFSVNLDKNVFQCFDAACAKKGDVIDLWAIVKGLSLRQAAIDLVRTFNLEPTPVTEKRHG
jgi:transposase